MTSMIVFEQSSQVGRRYPAIVVSLVWNSHC